MNVSRRALVVAAAALPGLTGCLAASEEDLLVQNERKSAVSVDVEVVTDDETVINETVTLAGRGGWGQRATWELPDPNSGYDDEVVLSLSVRGGPNRTVDGSSLEFFRCYIYQDEIETESISNAP